MEEKSKSLLNERLRTFAMLSESSIEKLLNIAIERKLLKGQKVLEEGKVCRKIVFVELGYFRVFLVKDGIEINTDFVFEGDFVTNLKSLRLPMPSDTNIQAGEDSVVYQFDKEELFGLYKESPEIESFGRALLEQMLIAREEHENSFKVFSAKERYHNMLATRPMIFQRVSLTQISSYLGMARETLSRMRKIR